MDNEYVLPDHPLDALVIDGAFRRVAVLSDVHGNLPALEACLADVAAENVDAVLFLGDLTWGPQPREVMARAQEIAVPTWFVRGNAERAVVQFAAGSRQTERPTDDWMVAAHGPDGVAELDSFAPALRVTVGAVGGMRLCHGSPRSDMELFTPATPPARVALATVGVDELTIGHGHTHLQYWRTVGERTLFGPGSVGLPYGTGDRPGARWALVGDDIQLRVSPYDIEQSIRIARSVHYPGLPSYEKYLRTPLSLDDLVADEKTREWAD
ncbi:MAG TPA: metallophosphoesterase family protein [Galbitalea sp.]|nr:metallophosphoesterase family protein [Galbitalea sp.]